MLKRNNKGFMLMETLLVSVFIASTLIFLYIQFQKVRDSYQSSFTYNTVIGTYASSNFLKYIQENGIENLSETINSGTVYVDLTTCPGGYLSNTSLCKKLITDLGIKKVVYASSDTTNLITRMNNTTDFSPKFKTFVKNIKVTNRISYRLLFEYNDETYSTVLARSKNTPEIGPTETLVATTCEIYRTDLQFTNGCDMITPSTTSNLNISSANDIYVNGNYKANTKYRLEIILYSSSVQFYPSMGGGVGNNMGVEYPGSWVTGENAGNVTYSYTFTTTEADTVIRTGAYGTYLVLSNINGMTRLLNIKVYEIT